MSFSFLRTVTLLLTSAAAGFLYTTPATAVLTFTSSASFSSGPTGCNVFTGFTTINDLAGGFSLTGPNMSTQTVSACTMTWTIEREFTADAGTYATSAEIGLETIGISGTPTIDFDLVSTVASVAGSDASVVEQLVSTDTSLFEGPELSSSFTWNGIGTGTLRQTLTLDISASSTITYTSGTGVGLETLISEAEATVPEPSILALMGLGLAGIGYQRRRKASR